MSRVMWRVRERQMLAHRNAASRPLSYTIIETPEEPLMFSDYLGIAAFILFVLCSLAGFGLFIYYTFFK